MLLFLGALGRNLLSTSRWQNGARAPWFASSMLSLLVSPVSYAARAPTPRMLTTTLADPAVAAPPVAVTSWYDAGQRLVKPISGSPASSEKRMKLAREWVMNEGFYSPAKKELMSDDFVFMGPVVGPLNVQDYLGTLGVFKIYEAFPDVEVSAAPFTQDPAEPDRYWSVIRVTGTHTADLDVGSAKVPATGKSMIIGPQAVSVTFDEEDKVSRLTGGYICDVRDGETKDAGAMFAVMRSIGVPTPNPTGKTVR